jgi:cytochrome b subunit of formate dehydrogenase
MHSGELVPSFSCVSTLQPVVARAPFSFPGFSVWALNLLRVGVGVAQRLLVSWLTIHVAASCFLKILEYRRCCFMLVL